MLFAVLLIKFSVSSGQVCDGTLGDPVVKIDFGSGTTPFGPQLGSATTTYKYVTGTPNDGEYTIVKTTNGMHYDIRGWYQIVNHDNTDPNGYMMVVNASNSPGLFYQKEVTGLCPNTTYELAAWVINLLNYAGIKPNITFAVYDTNGVLIGTPYNTGDLPEKNTWTRYGYTFRTPANVSTVVLKMINNGPGGDGNDIALDDITFSPCGPAISPLINGTYTARQSTCVGNSGAFKLEIEVGTGYASPEIQWQHLSGATWTNITGETATALSVNINTSAKTTERYRALVAESGSIGAPNCRSVSPEFILSIEDPVQAVATANSPACIGGDLILTSNEGAFYKWTGPNGFSSTERSPVIRNATAAAAGTYTLVLTSSCESTAQVEVVMVPPPVATVDEAEVTLCLGSAKTLSASGGTTYSWLPLTGLTGANTATPVAAPLVTTTYTVTAVSGTCTSTATVKVNVNAPPLANAGQDKVIVEGQSAKLEGTASGDNITWRWSPATALDDPTSLTPLATPAADTRYKLTVTSAAGCVENVDEVFVRVYKNVNVQNTFSPNGDGINDVWTVEALAAYPENSVKIFNRNGMVVFRSKGTAIQWDGKYKDKYLAPGVYYYTILLGENLKPMSGALTIIK